jgi:hypothetical protein
MRDVVARIQTYVRTYPDQDHYQNYSDTTFIDDMLYGIGLSLDPKRYYAASGFDRFKAVLRERIQDSAGESQP